MEQLDKEIFSLKMRCYYLEEALKKSGKDFNQKALEENTNLKVDKLTLERDMRSYRKQLRNTEKELENCRQRMEEYLEKLKQSNADESLRAELDRLGQIVDEKDAQIRNLEAAADSKDNHEQEVQALKDSIADLEHELRQKDQELDEKDDQIDQLKQASNSPEEEEELRRELEDRDDEIKSLQDALRTTSSESDRKLREKDRALELKDDEVRDLEKELENANRDESFAAKSRKAEDHQHEVDRLHKELENQQARARQESDDLKKQLEQAHNRAATESQQRVEDVDEKEHEIRALHQKLEMAEGRDQEGEKLHDQIADLEFELREKERSIDEKDIQIDGLKTKVGQIENEFDEELIAAQDRIQELEVEKERQLKDLQVLRDAERGHATVRSQVLGDAEERIANLQSSLDQARENEKHLHRESHRLKDDLAHVERELDKKESQAKEDSENWAKLRRNAENERNSLEQKVRSLEEVISQLRESEGTLSGKELALQRLLDSERQQHTLDQEAAKKQLSDANLSCDELRESSQKSATQLRDLESQNSRITQEKHRLKEKIQALEDEIEVLQSPTRNKSDRSVDDLAAAKSESESLRRQLDGLKADLAREETAHAAVKSELRGMKHRQSMNTSSKVTPSGHRGLQASGINVENDREKATELEARIKIIDAERQALQSKLEECRSSLQRLRVNPLSPTKLTGVQTSRDPSAQIAALKQQNEELEDDLDVLASDLDAATAARDEALTTVRDLRKQLSDSARASENKYRAQVTAYERDITNLEAELDTAKTTQRETEIKADTAIATVARLRKRLEGAENDLATARARERTSASPESKRVEQRELRDAQARVEEIRERLTRREERVRALEAREDELRTGLKNARDDRRAAVERAESLAADLDELRAKRDELTAVAQSAKKDGDAVVKKRHAAELRGLAKQIEYLSARCSRAEKLRQDAAFAKGYVGKVVEVYARINRLDLRICRDMGVVIDAEAVGEDSDEPVQLGGHVDATPRGKGGSGVSRRENERVGVKRREKRPTLKHVALMIRALLRMRKRAEGWREVRRGHEGILNKWRALREERRALKAL